MAEKEQSLVEKFRALSREGMPEEKPDDVIPQETAFVDDEDEEIVNEDGLPFYLTTEARLWDHYIAEKRKRGEEMPVFGIKK
jgi:hypothetical protein